MVDLEVHGAEGEVNYGSLFLSCGTAKLFGAFYSPRRLPHPLQLNLTEGRSLAPEATATNATWTRITRVKSGRFSGMWL